MAACKSKLIRLKSVPILADAKKTYDLVITECEGNHGRKQAKKSISPFGHTNGFQAGRSCKKKSM